MITVNTKEEKAPSLAIFALADTPNVRLGIDTGGRARGHKAITRKVGPWSLSVDVIVEQDYRTATSAATWVKLRKHLWGYNIAHDARLYMVLFDASVVKLITAEVQKFATGKLATSLAKIEPGIVASFEHINRKWTPCEPPLHLIGRQAAKRTHSAGKRTPARP